MSGGRDWLFVETDQPHSTRVIILGKTCKHKLVQVDWRKEDRKVMFGAKMPVMKAGPASLTIQRLGKEFISSCR